MKLEIKQILEKYKKGKYSLHEATEIIHQLHEVYEKNKR